MSDALWYGFDPSLAHFGYAVCRFREGVPFFVALGVIVTAPEKGAKSKTDDNRRRVEGIARELRALVTRHGKPDVIAVEALALMHGRTTLTVISSLGRVRGLVDALAAEHGVSAREFQPQALKSAITGNRSAEKAEVERALARHYCDFDDLLSQVRPANREHAADAAAAIHAATTNAARTEE